MKKPKSGRKIHYPSLAHHKLQLMDDGIILATRAGVAESTSRHESQVRRHCQPIACDVGTKAMLFDLDAATATLCALDRRFRRVA